MPPQNINISATANTGGLITNINRASASFNGLGRSIAAAGKGMAQLGTVGARALAGFSGTALASGVRAIGMLGGGMQRLNNYFSQHSKVLQSSATYYKGLVGQVVSLNRTINVLGSSIRQIGQGLQNFAIVFSLYVSAPIGAFITQMTRGLIDFQDALIEVRRTTGLANDELELLTDLLQQIALTTPTSRTELATMAAAWGRLGITGAETIAKLTEESDKLRIATTLTADQVVDDLGKIGAIYFESSTDFADQYDNIASAINELGQASAVNESEIVAAFLRVAPVSAQLGLSLPDVLGLSATVAERAASPERAGTQLARALTQQASNLKKFAEVLGTTEDEVRALIDADPVAFFVNTAEAISQIDSATRRVDIGEALFGGVGSKAVNALAANLPELYGNLLLSNEAFEDGTSIQREFERSLDSVKVQLGILRNNFEFLGSTVAEVVLPYITQFSAAAIPALQSAAQAFENLSDRTKVLTVAFGAMITVAGPVLLFLGSLLFSVGIITTGFTALFTQVIGIGVGFGRMAFAVLSLLAPISLLRIGVLGIGATFLYVYNVIGDSTNRFAEFASNAFSWGYELINTYAGGILQGAVVVQRAIGVVIDSFVGFIQAFSPPRIGPLREVGEWGNTTMKEYAGGLEKGGDAVESKAVGIVGRLRRAIADSGDSYQMGQTIGEGISEGLEDSTGPFGKIIKNLTESTKSAMDDAAEYIITVGAKFSGNFANSLRGLGAGDFTFFQDAFGAVRGVIESVGSNLGLDRQIIDQNVIRGAEAVLELVNTGDGGALKGISDLLGGLGGDLIQLVSSQKEYNNATKELERIKDRSKDSGKALRDEIAAITARTDLTLDQKSALIRAARVQARYRKEQTEEEEKAAQDRVDALEDEFARRRGIVDVLRQLIFPAEKEKIKKDSDDIGDALSEGFDADKYTQGLEDAQDKIRRLFEDAEEQTANFLDRIDRAREIWRGFIAGITGADVDLSSEWENGAFWEGFIPGQNIRTALDEIKEQFDGVKDSINGIGASFERLTKILGGGNLTGYLGLSRQVLDDWTLLEKIIYNIGFFFGSASKNIEDFYADIEDQRKNVADIFRQADQSASSSSTNYASAFIQNLDFGGLGAAVAEMLNIAISDYLNPGGQAFQTLQTTISSFLGGIVNFATEFINTADLTGVSAFVSGIINTMIQSLAPENINYSEVQGAITKFVQTILDVIAGIDLTSGTNFNIIQNIANSILRGLEAVELDGSIVAIKNIISNILWAMAGLDYQAFFGLIFKIAGAIINVLSSAELWGGLVVVASSIVDAIVVALPQAIEDIEWSDVFEPIHFRDMAEAIVDAVYGAVKTFGGAVLNRLLDPTLFGARAEFSKQSKSGETDLGFSDWLEESDRPKLTDRLSRWFGLDRGEAKQAGKEIGAEVTKGLEEHVEDGTTAQSTSQSIDTFLGNVDADAQPNIISVGNDFGNYIVTGMAEEYGSTETQTQYDEILTSLAAWEAANVTTLKEQGKDYGSLMILGLIESLSDADQYMSWMVSSIRGWIELAGQNSIKRAGFDFGLVFVEGVVEAILAAEQRIIDAVIPARDANGNIILAPLPTNPYSEPNLPSPSSFNPNLVAAISNEPEPAYYDIDINISSNQNVDRALARKLADMVEDEMRKKAQRRGY